MKKYLVLAIVILGVALWYVVRQTKAYESKWKIAEANVKAYCSQLNNSSEQNRALQLTVDQLQYFNDSVLNKLDATRKELNIKDKNLKALQYIASQFTRTDTVRLNDTIFKEPAFAMDTLLGDEWCSVKLGLQYPSMIVVKPEFKSEKHIVVSTKKETINPPKKFFLFRWFQRKHEILTVDVVEKNPYVENAGMRYIEILK